MNSFFFGAQKMEPGSIIQEPENKHLNIANSERFE